MSIEKKNIALQFQIQHFFIEHVNTFGIKQHNSHWTIIT